MLSDDGRFIPHSEKQERALFCGKRFMLLGTGTQWGKTATGAMRMFSRILEAPGEGNNYIITAPSYPTMVQSTLPPFLKIMHGRGDLNKKDNVFKVKQGANVWLRTETDPDSIVGITNVRHIWSDEAGKYRLYFWENILARADFCGCGVDLTTSPYALNWIYKRIIKPYKAGKLTDTEVISAASWENPYHSLHDPVKREEAKYRMDERRFNAIYGGNWDRMDGLVYDCWDDFENLTEFFQMPSGTTFYAGIDWGYNPDPFALVIIAQTPGGMTYGVHEHVKGRMTINDIVELCVRLKNIYHIKHFFCDPSQPASIEELNRAGCHASGADNTIRRGIDVVYEMVKTRRYKEFRGAMPLTRDEMEQYHYPELRDLKPDQDSREELPVDQSNHCLDALRYVLISTYRKLEGSIKPTIIRETRDTERLETLEEKFRRLRRLKSRGSQTENFS
jgi:hypothetical protein